MSNMVQLPDGRFEELSAYENAPELKARSISVDCVHKFPAIISSKVIHIENSLLNGLKELNCEGHVTLKNVKGNAQTIKIVAPSGLTFLNVKGVRLSPNSEINGTIFATSLTGIPKCFHDQVMRGVLKANSSSYVAFNPYFMKKGKTR